MKPILSPDFDFKSGYVLPMNKPLGWTSSDLVRKVKNTLYKTGHHPLKVGHAGTLDPLATGILIICIGKATKQADALQAEEKEYVATIQLGGTTPSCDLEHPIDQTYPWEHITRASIESTLQSMEGEQLQLPPIYSAKMIDGRRAYDYARSGTEVTMRQALINIYSMELVALALPNLTLRIRCSKGTYIRSIARDLGEKLNSGGHLTGLCRSHSGNFTLDDCFTLEEVMEILTKRPANQKSCNATQP